MKIELYLFDLMETVVADPFYRDLPWTFDLTMEKILECHRPQAWIDFELGRIDEAEYLKRMFSPELVEVPYAPERFREEMWSGYRFLPGMESLLEKLRQGGASLGVASNYTPWFEVIRNRLELDLYFHSYHLSYRLGVRKPDEGFYRKVLQQCSVPADQILFVDDRSENVEAARRMGMRGILFTGAEELASRMRG